MEQQLFSIIVPMYNVEKYICQCIESVLTQTYDGFELILVDDVSTDNTAKIAADYACRYPDKITFIQHSVNTRQGGARNSALEIIRGDYVMFLDSDDYLKPDTLKILLNILTKENADIVEFTMEWVSQNGAFLRKDSWPQLAFSDEGRQHPLLLSNVGPCNKVFKRSLFSSDIRFPEKYYYEDYWTVPKLLLSANQVFYIDDGLYCYRQHSASTMHDRNIEKTNDILLGTDELLQYFRDKQFSSEKLKEFECMVIEAVLINSTLRINSIDPRCEMQTKLLQYMYDHFPDFERNPYISWLPAKKQGFLKLICKQQYKLLYLRYHCRNQITGIIKRLINTLIGEKFIRRLH